MPRAARYVLPGLAVHVVQRGISRLPCFFSDVDYETYLRYLADSSRRFGCLVHAYCLMTNHVHLLVTPKEHDACGRFMKHLGQRYVQTVNARMGRTGTLWEGRFHSSLARSDEHVLACYRYIELNPVRAGMVQRPGDYFWSSYGGNVGRTVDAILCPHDAYQSLGELANARAAAYAALCAAGLPDAAAQEIRKATRVGCVIGTPRRSRGRPSLAK